MRTSALILAGVAALAPVVAAPWQFAAAAEAPRAISSPFAPPLAPMVLSRTVIRELADGKQIVVKRSYRVQFLAATGGYMLTGTPIAVSVDVPPVLARLGELERQRSDAGPFPIKVDSQGLIHTDARGSGADATGRHAAQSTATGLIEGTSLAVGTKRDAVQLLGNMAADPRTSPWPIDLFVAHDGERRQYRSVALADGSLGEIEVLLRIDKWLPCGMPALFERVITTELAGTRRVSREVWTLEPIVGT